MVARQDQVTDPHITEALLMARRGTAYFSRYLGQLSAEDMRGPSLIPQWDRAHVVAHVGYHARQLAHVIEKVRTGLPSTEPDLPQAHNVDYGASLPDSALRNLHMHAAVHLNVEWRDLPGEKWETLLAQGAGQPSHLVETVWQRAQEVWLHAIDLNNGARYEDFPPRLLERLFQEALDQGSPQTSPDRHGGEVTLPLSDQAIIRPLHVPAAAGRCRPTSTMAPCGPTTSDPPLHWRVVR